MNRISKIRRYIRFWQLASTGITILFHPLLLLTYFFSILLAFNPLAISNLSQAAYPTFITLIFLTTFGMPLLLVMLYLILFRKTVSFRSLFMENGKDRVMPFLIVAILYSIMVYFILQSRQFVSLVHLVFLFTTLAILITAFVSNYWKISAHAIGYSGMLAMLTVVHIASPHSNLFHPYTGLPLSGLFLLGGALISARLNLGAHNPNQVYAGFIMGLSIGSCLWFFI